MSERSLHTLAEGGSFFESPRWHEGRWWVSDFYRRLVLTVGGDEQGRRQPLRRADLEGPPARGDRARAVLGADLAELRGEADKRQVDRAKVALQHNIGLGGAAVVTVYKPAA